MKKSVAIVGCGGWGKNLARNLHELGALACIVDPSPQAQSLASQFGLPHFATVDAILSDLGIKAVVIATPASTHYDIASIVLKAGKDVYLEKPISLSVKDGIALEAQASTMGLILMVGHLLHYHPVYLTLKRLIHEGRIGTVRHITSSRLNLGLLRHEENVLWSFSPHDISMVLGIIEDSSCQVSAVGSDFFQPGIVDVCTMHLRFRNGCTADIRASWFNPEKVQKLVVVGSEAIAVFSDTATWEEKLVIHDYVVEWDGQRPRIVRGNAVAMAVPFGEPLKAEMQHFLDCIASRATPRTDAAEAIRVLSVLQAGQASLDGQGDWINV